MSRDVAACKKAGVNVIWVSWGYDVIETVKRCTGLYGSYTDGNCASSTGRILKMNTFRDGIHHIEFW